MAFATSGDQILRSCSCSKIEKRSLNPENVIYPQMFGQFYKSCHTNGVRPSMKFVSHVRLIAQYGSPGTLRLFSILRLLHF